MTEFTLGLKIAPCCTGLAGSSVNAPIMFWFAKNGIAFGMGTSRVPGLLSWSCIAVRVPSWVILSITFMPALPMIFPKTVKPPFWLSRIVRLSRALKYHWSVAEWMPWLRAIAIVPLMLPGLFGLGSLRIGAGLSWIGA